MLIYLINHNFSYETQSALQIFFPNEKFQISNSSFNLEKNKNFALVSRFCNNCFTTEIYNQNKILYTSKEKVLNLQLEKYYLRLSIFKCLSKFTNRKPKWGILSGIKPTKIIYDLLDEKDDEFILKYLMETHLLDYSKALLTLEVAKSEKKVLSNNSKCKGYHMYIGIPFCKSKCNYCSFTSFKIDKYVNLGLDEIYVEKLIKEIINTKPLFQEINLKSIYIGGGTPTSISAKQMEKILKCITENFDLSNCKEISYEAGRADTITKEKLLILKKYNVTRIAINPQTMNNSTLEKINRTHSVEDFLNVFNLAKQINFDNINIDLIFGLTGESYNDFLYSVKEVVKLNPDSITIHTLAVKRGASLKEDLSNDEIFKSFNYEDVKQLPIENMKDKGFYPYYMYRQKNMVGGSNFENIGFSKINKECLYNIITMEEKEDIVAFGAGATSRKILKDGSVQRAFNVTGVEEYIERIDEMIQRKVKLYNK